MRESNASSVEPEQAAQEAELLKNFRALHPYGRRLALCMLRSLAVLDKADGANQPTFSCSQNQNNGL